MIYFLACSDRIKIGYSNNPKARLRALSTGLPFDAELLGVAYGDEAEEKRLHQEFASERMTGEWFKDNPRLRALIDEISIRSVGVQDGDFLEFITVPVPPFQNALAAWRKTQKLTQREFGKTVGVSRWMVNRIEAGERKPSFSVALKIQQATGLSPADLVAQQEQEKVS